MALIKVEKVDAVNTEATDATATSAQRDAAALAGFLGLPLDTIQFWGFAENHAWLKCMLTRHINFQLMTESQSVDMRYKLMAIDSVIGNNPGLTLDILIDIVQMKLDCQTAEHLRGELAVWRQAAANETLWTASCQSPMGAVRSPRPSTKRSLGGVCGCGGGAGGDLLWQHILRLLMTRDPAVRWLHPAHLGHFQFVRSGAAAKSWGRTKSNENMSFEKMSRSIRQYYRQKCGVIQKVSNKARLEYKFNMSHPDVVRFIMENFPNGVAKATADSGNGAEMKRL